MDKKVIVLAALLSVNAAATAGIYRHDKTEAAYAALAASPQFSCVGQLLKQDKPDGSCVFIGGRYMISAAHCFIETQTRPDTIVQGNVQIYVNKPYERHEARPADFSVMLNGTTYHCKAFKLYPHYMDSSTRGGLDLALIELDKEVTDVQATVLNTSFDELHSDVVGVGFGVSGFADKPEDVTSEGKKLAGENVVDSLGGYKLNNRATVMFCDFDHPTNTECNKMGSAVPRPLEYICGGGDSGGGLFRQKNGIWELIGICHGAGVDVAQLLKTGYYGQVMEWTRISLFAGWIEEQMKQGL